MAKSAQNGSKFTKKSFKVKIPTVVFGFVQKTSGMSIVLVLINLGRLKGFVMVHYAKNPLETKLRGLLL